MLLRTFFSAMLTILSTCSAASTWTVEKKIDSMTDEARTSATTMNSDGASLSIYSMKDGSVWVNFSLPSTSFDVLATGRNPIYRVDKLPPRDLSRSPRLERLVKDHTPTVAREPKWVNFKVWAGNTGARSDELIELMDGSTVLFRYFLFTGGYKETTFTLDPVAISEALNMKVDAAMRASETMVKAMQSAQKACQDNAVRVDFSVCFDRAKACAVQAAGDQAAFAVCNAR